MEGRPRANVLQESGPRPLAELQQVKLFDAYAGDAIEEGHRSLAYRLRFQADDRTLTDDEVAALRSKCIQLVEKKTEARLRL